VDAAQQYNRGVASFIVVKVAAVIGSFVVPQLLPPVLAQHVEIFRRLQPS
jgi:hypothetical protein